MNDIYLDNIPNDILNIIFYYIKPSIKYKLNKQYFYKYYYIRFNYINNNIFYFKSINIRNIIIIKNYNYIKYLIKNDGYIFLRYIIDNKYKYDKTFFIVKKPIIFENNKHKNLIDLCKFYSDKFKSYYIKEYLNSFIQNNNVSITKYPLIKYNYFNYYNKNYNKKKIWIA